LSLVAGSGRVSAKAGRGSKPSVVQRARRWRRDFIKGCGE